MVVNCFIWLDSEPHQHGSCDDGFVSGKLIETTGTVDSYRTNAGAIENSIGVPVEKATLKIGRWYELGDGYHEVDHTYPCTGSTAMVRILESSTTQYGGLFSPITNRMTCDNHKN